MVDYRGFSGKLLFVNNINVNVDVFTFHSHPLPELLLQSALPILQLQLSSAWGMKKDQEELFQSYFETDNYFLALESIQLDFFLKKKT